MSGAVAGTVLYAVLTVVVVGATAGLLGVRAVDLVCRRCGEIMPGSGHECSERR